MLGLYGVAVTLSAFLLFVVQPFAGRLLLPRLGGAPSVWTACLLFFQSALLLGYGWSWLSRRIPSRALRVGAHVVLVGAAAIALPPLPPADLVLSGTSPTLESLGFLARTVGLPFLALSTTAPMLQAWLAESSHPARERPYVLYAASNAGSLASLLLYPPVIEPLLGLAEQALVFSIGYGVLVLLVVACAGMLLRGPARAAEPARRSGAGTTKERASWLVFSLVPSALLSSVTSYVSMDLAPMPLLWVAPLALYLLTFVLAFRAPGQEPSPWLSRIARLLGASLVVATGVHANSPLSLLLALHLTFFGLAAFVVHRRLARAVPEPARLTEFYVVTALGGVLGTLLAGPVATLLLQDVWEYPLAIAAACALTLAPASAKTDATPRSHAIHAGVVLALTVALALGIAFTPLAGSPLAALLVFGPPVVLAYRQSLVPLRYGLCLLAIVVGGTVFSERGTTLLRRERDFFGVLRVVDDGGERVLLHGTTLHGAQALDTRDGCEPLAYYARSGPLGTAIAAHRTRGLPGDVSAIGLGAGSVACYALPGERWTFSEISPAVVEVASDPALFTFLTNAVSDVDVRVEDGRRGLEATPPGSRVLVLVDAFSSDAVPAHLLTREALRVYLRALRPGGWVLLHVSNRSLDLVRIVSAVVAAEDLAARVNVDASEVGGVGGAPSWIVVAAAETELDALDATGRFVRLPPSSVAAWSDDRASLWSALR